MSAAVLEFLRAQLELGANEVYFDEPLLLAQAMRKKSTPTQMPRPHIPEYVAPIVEAAQPNTSIAADPTRIPITTPGDVTLSLLVPQNSNASSSNSVEADLAPIEKAESLTAFHEALIHHPYYRLSPSKPGRIALGQGPITPQVMLVALSPSEQELSAKAFIPGPEGDMLRKLMESLGISYSLCYTTWLAKKPLSSPPLPRQLGALRRMLAAEVKLVQPGLVILLGEAVFRAALNSNASIHEEGGKAMSFADMRTTAIIDPASMFANPALKMVTWKTHLPRSGFFRMQGS